MLGISAASGLALSSSLYLQYVAGYQPCIYCYVLRYLTLGVLALSVFGLLIRSWTADVSAATAALGLVGIGVSVYLVLDETFPSASICTACSFSPVILGVSLYYYSLAFMTLVLGVSLTMFRSH